VPEDPFPNRQVQNNGLFTASVAFRLARRPAAWIILHRDRFRTKHLSVGGNFNFSLQSCWPRAANSFAGKIGLQRECNVSCLKG